MSTDLPYRAMAHYPRTFIRYKWADRFPHGTWPDLEVVDVEQQYVVRLSDGGYAVVEKDLYEVVK